MTTDLCAIHDEPIIDEPGGVDMPTIHGRRYCPQCQKDLMAALDKDALRYDHPLPESIANAVYDVLVARCGAWPGDREAFVINHTNEFISEYRFIGSLGFGGKLYRTDARGKFRVSCYREDETPERLAAMEQANAVLKEQFG